MTPLQKTTYLLPKPCYLIQLFSLANKNRTRNCCCCYHSSLSPEKTQIINRLVSIFTLQQPPFSSSSIDQELTNFGSILTTDVVEASLKSFKNWKIALRFFNWASTQNGYSHNCYTFNTMASILSGARQNAPLKALAMDLINSSCSMSPGALGFFIRCLGFQGLIDEANVLFDQVKKMGLCVPNSYSYNCLLEIISKLGFVELMEKRVNEMRDEGWEPDKYTMTPVLQCYCTAGKFEKALDVFNQMYEKGWFDSHVLSMLLLSFTKWGEVDKAFELFERMSEFAIGLNEKTYYVLIHGFVRENRVEKALQLLDKMQSAGFVPGISVYAVLIEGLCKYKEFGKALLLYSEMNEFGIRPDVNLLRVLISSLPGETEIISLIKNDRSFLDKKSLISLLNCGLSSLVNNGSIDKAHHLLRAMMKDEMTGDPEVDDLFMIDEYVFPDTDSFRIVIDGLCQKGELNVALELFKDMDRIGCQRSLLLYNNIINALSNSNRLELCHQLLTEMKVLGFRPSQFTHNSIFGCLCQREDVTGALDMLQEMRVHGHEPWIKHYTLLVKKLCRNRKPVEAGIFLAKMVEQGFIPDLIAYSAAIDGLIKIEEVDQALKLFRNICAYGRCPDVVAYNTIINGLCKAKRVSEAQDVYSEMLEKGLIPSVVSYNLLIDTWCKNDDLDRAIACLSMMDEERREPNVITYTTLIDGLCNAGIFDQALLLWNEMVRKGNGCSPNRITFMALICGLCKCRKPDTAFIYLQEMEEKQMKPDTYVYVSLIEAFLSDSNAPLALDILRKMIQNRSFPDLLDNKHKTLRDAVVKLFDDVRTSSNVRDLIADGSLPTIPKISDVDF